jgi:long-chain acyl-CoA synthetase
VGELGFWNVASNNPGMEYLVEPDHTVHTAGELLAANNQVVHGLRELGLPRRRHVAVLLPNGAPWLELLLAAAGRLVPGADQLPPRRPEIAYIVNDSGAKAFIAHERFAEEVPARRRRSSCPTGRASRWARSTGSAPTTELKAASPPTSPMTARRCADELHLGHHRQPKGVKRDLPELDPDTMVEMASFLNMLFGIQPFDDNVHLTVAPLYHTAVGQFTQNGLHAGHTVVLMDKWTPEGTLERIDRYRVTTSHMVPTMFTRCCACRRRPAQKYDVSSLRAMMHSAARARSTSSRRCSTGGATASGSTTPRPRAAAPWPRAPRTGARSPAPSASRGRSARSRSSTTTATSCPPGEIGTVWMRMGDRTFEYHGDEDKTRKSWNEQGFFTVGDAGEVDEDGWLFLRDRTSELIISGGVNIYPAETESVLFQHPAVLDVAVFGIPHEDWGEEVKAAVELAEGYAPSEELEQEILEHCREPAGGFKCRGRSTSSRTSRAPRRARSSSAAARPLLGGTAADLAAIP